MVIQGTGEYRGVSSRRKMTEVVFVPFPYAVYKFPTFLRFSATLVPKLPVDARRLDFACKSRFVATGFDIGRRTTSTQSVYKSSDSSRVHSCGSWQTHRRYPDYTRHLLYSACKTTPLNQALSSIALIRAHLALLLSQGRQISVLTAPPEAVYSDC